MPVHDIREALGSFDLDLHPTTPQTILDYLDLDTYGYTPLVVLPQHLETHTFTDTQGLDFARYTGIYRANNLSSRREGEPITIEGCHLSVLLGDEDGKGDIPATEELPGAIKWYSGTTQSWIYSKVLQRGNGITAGTITTDTSTQNGKVEVGTTARETLDWACRIYDYEWRVNPDGTLDAGPKATLHPTTTTPTAVVLPDEGGTDGSLTGIEATVYRLDSDIEDHASAVLVTGRAPGGGDIVGSITATVPATPYKDFAGGALDMVAMIDSKHAQDTTDLAIVALKQKTRSRYTQTRRHLRIQTDRYDIAKHVQPGSGIYVYDPDQDLYSTSNQIHYRGRLIYPVILRAEAVKWPVEQGMGVYLRVWDGAAFTWTDLTPHVMWEDPGAEISVGDVYRTLPSPRPRLTA